MLAQLRVWEFRLRNVNRVLVKGLWGVRAEDAV